MYGVVICGTNYVNHFHSLFHIGHVVSFKFIIKNILITNVYLHFLESAEKTEQTRTFYFEDRL